MTPNARKDITERAEIIILLRRFYEKLLADASISYIFIDIARLDLEAHLPVLADFWEMVLFGRDSYRKNAMKVHTDLAAKVEFTKTHFDTWLRYFSETVDEMFEGEKAFLAKQRALSIATTMQIKLLQQ